MFCEILSLINTVSNLDLHSTGTAGTSKSFNCTAGCVVDCGVDNLLT